MFLKMCLNPATFAFFTLVTTSVKSQFVQLEDQKKGTELIFDINDEHKAQYLNQNFYSNAYNYGYEVSPNGQFHHEVHGPDDVTYGCYGYVDPLGKLKTTFYISDGWGYRVVKPGQNVELFFHEHEHHEDNQSQKHENDDHRDHHGILTAWNKLHFPPICAQFEETNSNPNIIPPSDHGTPKTPGIPGIPKHPAIPGTPETPFPPIHPEKPETPAIPRRPEHPGIPTSPKTPDIQKESKIPETHNTPSHPEYPEKPDMPKTPSTPKIPGRPRVPDIPETHSTSSYPEYSEKPGTPKIPSTPKIPGRPRVPDIPETQKTPSHPGFPREPARPEIFSTPDLPKKSFYPEYPGTSGTSVTPGKPFTSRTPIVIEKPSQPVHSSLSDTFDISDESESPRTSITPNTPRKSGTSDVPGMIGTPLHPTYPSISRIFGTPGKEDTSGTPASSTEKPSSHLRDPGTPGTSGSLGTPETPNILPQPVYADTPKNSDTESNAKGNSDTQNKQDNSDENKSSHSSSSDSSTSNISDTSSGQSNSEKEAPQSFIYTGTPENLPLSLRLRIPGTSFSPVYSKMPSAPDITEIPAKTPPKALSQPGIQSSSNIAETIEKTSLFAHSNTPETFSNLDRSRGPEHNIISEIRTTPSSPAITKQQCLEHFNTVNTFSSTTASHPFVHSIEKDAPSYQRKLSIPDRPRCSGEYIITNPSSTLEISDQPAPSKTQQKPEEQFVASSTSDNPRNPCFTGHSKTSETQSRSEESNESGTYKFPGRPKYPGQYVQNTASNPSSPLHISEQSDSSEIQHKSEYSSAEETSDTSDGQDTFKHHDISKTESYSEYPVIPEAVLPFKKARTDEKLVIPSTSNTIDTSGQSAPSRTQQKPDQVDTSNISNEQDTSRHRDISKTESYSGYSVIPEITVPFKETRTDEYDRTKISPNKSDFSGHLGDSGRKQHAEYLGTSDTLKEQNISGYRSLPSHANYPGTSNYPSTYPSMSVTSRRTGLFELTGKLENMFLRRPSHPIRGGYPSYLNNPEGPNGPARPIGDIGHGIRDVGGEDEPGPDGPWPTGSPGPDGPWPGDPKYYPGANSPKQSQYHNPVKILRPNSYTPMNTNLYVKSNSNFTSTINNGKLSDISSPIKVSETVDIDHSRFKMQKYEHINGFNIYQENISHNTKAINSLMHDTLKTSDHLKYTFSKNQTDNLEKHETTDTYIKPYGLRTENKQNNRYEVTEDTNLAEEPEANFEQFPVNHQKHYQKEFQYLANHSYKFEDIIKDHQNQPYKIDHQGSQFIVHTKFDKHEENGKGENINSPKDQTVGFIRQVNTSSEGERTDHSITATGVQPPHPINVNSFSTSIEPNPEACPCYLVDSYKEHDTTSSTTTTPLISQLGFIPVIFVPYCPDNKANNYKIKLMYPSATSVPYTCNACNTLSGNVETKLIGLDQLNNVENLKDILSQANLGFLNVPVKAVPERRKIRSRKIV